MINFMLPGMYENSKLNFIFLSLFHKHPEYFEKGVKINAVYGNFQFCTWDGGRIFLPFQYRQASREKIEKIIKGYNNNFKIPIRFVFTNSLIQERDLYDRFNNLVLKMADTGINEVVVSSPILEEYIRTEYSSYKIISSTTKCLKNPEEALEEVKKDYFLTCLDYNLNKNWDFLNSIPKEERNKVEILINAICPASCQNRKNHYRLNGISNLEYGKLYQASNCHIFTSTLDPVMERGNNLTKQDIYNKYYPAGFSHFKIEGRTLTPLENACNYVKFMVKPEYQLFVLNEIFLDMPSNDNLILTKF